MEILAPAKLNLCLEVLRRREDGYHEIDTVMQAVDLHDRLVIEPADRGVHLRCEGTVRVPADETNLAHRAATGILREAGVDGGVEILLEKRIPVGGGLGGGSSDAAATLMGVDRVLRLGTPAEEMQRMAAALGSDVPFFLTGGAARCRGRGDEVEPIRDAPEIPYLIVWPGFPSMTAGVYEGVDFGLTQKTGVASFVVRALVSNQLQDLGRRLENHLEEVVVRTHPELGEVRRALESHPFLGVGMTGSGSCLFGLLDPSREEVGLRGRVEEATGHRVFRVRGLARGSAP